MSEHFEADGDAILQSARKLSLEGIVRRSWPRPIARPFRDWTKAKVRVGQEVVLGGWKTTGGKFRSLMAGVHRAIIWLLSAWSAPALARIWCAGSCRR